MRAIFLAPAEEEMLEAARYYESQLRASVRHFSLKFGGLWTT